MEPHLNKIYFFPQLIQPGAARHQDFPFDTASYAATTAVTLTQPQVGGSDPELSELLNTVIDIVPDYQGNLLTGIIPEPSTSITAPVPPQNQDFNEKMAINAITKSLMQIESTGAYNSSPPAYSMHNINTQSNQQVIISFHTFYNKRF